MKVAIMLCYISIDDDYMLLINELTFDSSSTQNISIKINHDGIREKQEEFIVQLHLPEHSTGLVIQHDIATVKIIDEDCKNFCMPFYIIILIMQCIIEHA